MPSAELNSLRPADAGGFERLVLASGSARRHELLRRAGVRFDVRVTDVDETPLAGEDPASLVVRLAETKALAAGGGPRDLVLGCDTTVAHQGRALGKPRDGPEALEMLMALSGGAHTVITGFCVAGNHRVLVSDTVVTKVFMRPFDDSVAGAYVAGGEPFGKAGAYAIQGEGGRLVDHIEGSFTNVMGLPVDEVMPHLRHLVPAAVDRTSRPG